MLLGAVLVILQLIYLEGILSLDNVAVLAAMVSRLPQADPIPWPRRLHFLRQPAHQLLGGQRLGALRVGLVGAYVGRVIMLLLAAAIIRNRWLLLLGGIYLIYLAAEHLGRHPRETAMAVRESSREGHRRERSFWKVVLAVELADLAFSLDNVIAAIALSRQIWVVLTGVGLGILLMRIAAGIFERILRRYPILEAAAYLLVLAIGAEVLFEELLRIHLTDTQKFAISLAILLLSVVYDRNPALQRVGRSFAGVQRVLGVVRLFLIVPVKLAAWLVGGVLTLIRILALAVLPRRRPTGHKPSAPP